MKAPSPGVHVQELVLTIAGILLEFHLDQAVVVDRFQEAFREFLDRGKLDALHIGRGAPELMGMLTVASGDQAAMGPTVAKESTIRELVLPLARNGFLDHHLFGPRSEEPTSELQSLRHLVCRL